MNTKRILLIGITLLIVLVLIIGCKPATPAEPDVQPEEAQTTEEEAVSEEVEAEAAEPIVLRVGGLSDIDGWNPWSNTSPYTLGSLVLEGFTDRGPASEGFPAVPKLADSWEVSEDGLIWTIHLHEEITFSDGTPVDANTVKEYLDWLRNEEMLFGYFASITNMVSVEVIDDLTLQYTNAEPMVSSADHDFPVMYILPPYIWSELGEDLYMFDNAEMIGTGPYVIAEYVPGSHIIFDAREDYYRGKPIVDRIIYTIYSNSDALVNALISGEVDLTMPDLTPEVLDALGENPNITIKENFPLGTFDLAFNMTDSGTGHQALKDPAVRLAIDQAIDKHQIVDVVFLGHATAGPTNWAVGPYYDGKLNPDLTMTPFNLDVARQTLEDAGYFDTDGDGVRETPEGEPLEFRLIYATDYATSLTMTEMIADWLSEAGIKVDIEAVDLGTWFYTVLDERDYDMAIDQRLSDTDPVAMESWLSIWATEGFSTTGGSNPELDDFIYGYMYSADEDVRQEMIYEAQRILNEERWFITLAGPHKIQAYRNDRFIFPEDVTHVDIGVLAPEGVLNVKVVK